MNTESDLHTQVIEYLMYQYHDVMVYTTMDGVKLPPGLAMKVRKLRCPCAGWPDIFVAEPLIDRDANKIVYCGLWIELKREGFKLKTNAGTWSRSRGDDIENQAKVHEKLRQRFFKAEFACGYNEATKLIDEYLRGIA